MTESVDPVLTPLIDVAVADLARRLHVEAARVMLVSARSLQWPDRGLGCPQPGMVYPQTPVDGALIELSYDGVVYPYHSGGSIGPFLCEHSQGRLC